MALLPTTVEADVCVLGAGPHGLAAAVHLRRADPDLRLVVVDPAGAWLQGWHDRFARAEIEVLRSPVVHHPSPDPYELLAYLTVTERPRSGLPYDVPTVEAFSDYCTDLIADTELDPPFSATAEAVCREGGSVLTVTDRGTVRADHLVVATNPHRRVLPDWVWPLLGREPGLFVYGSDVDLRELPDLTGERVLVVGGGLTAAHLGCGAADRGADTVLLTRRPLETRDFDTDPGWLGPRHLRAFDLDDDPESRLQTIRTARGGGTIPPWMRARLETLIEDGRLVVHEACDVRAADVDQDGSCVVALDDRSTVRADRIWLATGTTPDVGALRCLTDLVADAPVIGGVPLVDDRLQLGPHPVHVMGRLAMLTLGPAAGNLWGAQRAATRITRAITGVDLEHEAVVETRTRAG